MDVADLAVDVMTDKDGFKNDGHHNRQKQNAVTAEDVRSGAKAAASVAAAVGHVAADVTSAIFHGLQQQHQQHQQQHTSPHFPSALNPVILHPEGPSHSPNQPCARPPPSRTMFL